MRGASGRLSFGIVFSDVAPAIATKDRWLSRPHAHTDARGSCLTGGPDDARYAAMWTVTALRCGRGSAGGMRDCVAAAPFIGPTLSLDLFIVMFGIIWSHLWKVDAKIYIPFVRNDRMLSTLTVENTSVFVAGQTLISELPISCTLLACALVWRNLIAFGHNLIIWGRTGAGPSLHSLSRHSTARSRHPPGAV